MARNFHTPHCALLLDLRAVRGYYLHVHQHVLLAQLTTARASQLAHPAQPVQRSVLPSPASVADPQHLPAARRVRRIGCRFLAKRFCPCWRARGADAWADDCCQRRSFAYGFAVPARRLSFGTVYFLRHCPLQQEDPSGRGAAATRSSSRALPRRCRCRGGAEAMRRESDARCRRYPRNQRRACG